ncbi:DNA-binding NarL/FixJ family response regulator [Geodermatophilus bullaregiensis]|uniref:LuxR C-terminal-related transcriptional regulator n=1 Tax=Geodermatophilus bullaregiensis TaxID=1564160 RepID=UPI001957F6DC|nr:response regulator transcription factor [Geodermatophilus bullaregiensis]MBM7806755.1 DNA-binding NarL/FixJ family response regulator [Geodermatophilus bullaregiensis]
MGAPDGGVGGGAATGSGSSVRVLVCDDHEVLRHGLRTVLRGAPDLTVVAEAADVDEALSLAGSVRPDVALLGLEARGPGVRDLVRVLSAKGIRVVLLGEACVGSDAVEALKAGARGYVHVAVSPHLLIEYVRAVARGETVLDPSVTGELLSRLDGDRSGDGDRPVPNALTARQQTVAELVAEGLSNAEIAARLQVSRATVKGHITVALRRLNLRDRTQLAIHVHRATRPGGGPRALPVEG